MQCDNCKCPIPTSEFNPDYCMGCGHVLYMYFWNYISDEERGERLAHLRLFYNTFIAPQVVQGATFLVTIRPMVGRRRGSASL